MEHPAEQPVLPETGSIPILPLKAFLTYPVKLFLAILPAYPIS